MICLREIDLGLYGENGQAHHDETSDYSGNQDCVSFEKSTNKAQRDRIANGEREEQDVVRWR